MEDWDRSKCKECIENLDSHTCPFAEEIDDDHITECNCCPKHTQKCEDDI